MNKKVSKLFSALDPISWNNRPLHFKPSRVIVVLHLIFRHLLEPYVRLNTYGKCQTALWKVRDITMRSTATARTFREL